MRTLHAEAVRPIPRDPNSKEGGEDDAVCAGDGFIHIPHHGLFQSGLRETRERAATHTSVHERPYAMWE